MPFDIEECSAPPPRAEWDAFMREYYQAHVFRMAQVGFVIDNTTVENAVSEYWEDVDANVPPLGQTLLARDAKGVLVGSGVLKRVSTDVGELKRLFVRREARGAGLGRRLVEILIDTARRLGLRKLMVDALTSSTEMRALYRSLNFREVAPNPEATTAKLEASLIAHTIFLEYDLETG